MNVLLEPFSYSQHDATSGKSELCPVARESE